MKFQILIFILVLVSSEACLEVRDATPKCACKVQGIGYYPIPDYTNDTALIRNITSYVIEPPEITTDDCSVSVQCPDQYSLIVLDTDSYTMFGDYSADGFCDPIAQTWLVADDGGFSSFSRMNGICVNYSFHCDSCLIDHIHVRDPGVEYSFFCDSSCGGKCVGTCSRRDNLKCDTIKTWVENENGKYQVEMTEALGMVGVTCGNDRRWIENSQSIPKLTKFFCTFEDGV